MQKISLDKLDILMDLNNRYKLIIASMFPTHISVTQIFHKIYAVYF